MRKIQILSAMLVVSLYVFFYSDSISQTDEITTATYIGEQVTYYKKKLLLGLKTERLSDTTYTPEVNTFISSKNALTDSSYQVSIFTEVAITLQSFGADAINYIDQFKNSGLFEYVCFSGVIELNFFDPNDTRFNEQFHQYYNKCRSGGCK